MGGCASVNKESINAISNSSISSKKMKWKVNKKKDMITSAEKMIMNHFDRVESDVDNAIEEFETVHDQFNFKLDIILESNQIYNKIYNKNKLLMKLCADNNLQNLSNLIGIVHKAMQKLPQVKQTFSDLREELHQQQHDNDLSLSTSQTMRRRYVILYKIDEISITQFDQQITEWDQILNQYVHIIDEDNIDIHKNKGMLTNNNNYNYNNNDDDGNYKKCNRPSKYSIKSRCIGLIPSNQTQSTLNQTQNYL